MKTDFNFNTNQPIWQSVASLIILSFFLYCNWGKTFLRLGERHTLTKEYGMTVNCICWKQPLRGVLKGVLKKCSKFTGEHPCQSVISIRFQSNFTEITLWHGCSPVNLLHLFTTSLPKNTSEWMLLISGVIEFI